MCSAPGDDDGPRVVAAVREEERTLRAGDGVALREFVAQPATGFRRGAVLIIHDVWGYTDFYKDLARPDHGPGARGSAGGFLRPPGGPSGADAGAGTDWE